MSRQLLLLAGFSALTVLAGGARAADADAGADSDFTVSEVVVTADKAGLSGDSVRAPPCSASPSR